MINDRLIGVTTRHMDRRRHLHNFIGTLTRGRLAMDILLRRFDNKFEFRFRHTSRYFLLVFQVGHRGFYLTFNGRHLGIQRVRGLQYERLQGIGRYRSLLLLVQGKARTRHCSTTQSTPPPLGHRGYY